MRRRTILGAVGIGGGAVVAGCAALLSLDDVRYSGGASAADAGGGDSGTGLPMVVDDAGRRCFCLPEVPPGWGGPLVVDELADCTGEWPTEAARLYAGLDGGAHECSCRCSTGGAKCVFVGYEEGYCATQCATAPLTPVEDACAPRPPVDAASCSYATFDVEDAGGPCVPEAGVGIEPPRWARTARVCTTPRVSPAGVCEHPGDRCLPAHSASSAWCIVFDGGVPTCPSAYPDLRAYSQRYEDDRACSPCACTETGGPCSITVFRDDRCTMQPTVADAGVCVTDNSWQWYEVSRTSRACAPSGGTRVGGLRAEGDTTVCCRRE
jgi:hypothetical protein